MSYKSTNPSTHFFNRSSSVSIQDPKLNISATSNTRIFGKHKRQSHAFETGEQYFSPGTSIYQSKNQLLPSMTIGGRNKFVNTMQNKTVVNFQVKSELQSQRVSRLDDVPSSRDSIRDRTLKLKEQLDILEKIVPKKEELVDQEDVTKMQVGIQSFIQGSATNHGLSIIKPTQKTRNTMQNYSTMEGSKQHNMFGASKESFMKQSDLQNRLDTQISLSQSNSSEGLLPKIRQARQTKNNTDLQNYESLINKHKRREKRAIQKGWFSPPGLSPDQKSKEKQLRRFRAANFVSEQNIKLKTKIKGKVMSKIDKARYQENLDQLKLNVKMDEKKRVEKYNQFCNRVVDEAKNREKANAPQEDSNESFDLDDDEDNMRKTQQTVPLSQDSVGKNVGVTGHFISRIIEHEQEHPDDYQQLLQRQHCQNLETANRLKEHLDAEYNDGENISGAFQTPNPKNAKFSLKAKSRMNNVQKSGKSSHFSHMLTQKYIQIQDNMNQTPQTNLQIKMGKQKARKGRDMHEKGTMERLNEKLNISSLDNQSLGQLISNDILNNQINDINLVINQNKTDFDMKMKQPSRMPSQIDVGEQSITQSSFAGKFPDFKTGMTPRIPNASDLDPLDLAQEKVNARQLKLYKKKDFEAVNKRQANFKELMDITPAQTPFNNSEIIKAESSHLDSDLQDYPFRNHAKGKTIKNYKVLSNDTRSEFYKKAIEKNRLSFINTKQSFSIEDYQASQGKEPSEGFDSAYGDDVSENTRNLAMMTQLLQIEKQREEEKNKKTMLGFMDYITREKFPQNIEQVQNKIGVKAIKKGFAQYRTFKDPQVKQFAQHVQERREFFDMCKQAMSPRGQEQFIEDPSFGFMKICQENHIPVTSFLQKMKDKCLQLVGYHVNERICKALRTACKMYPACITQVLLDNNGIRDEGMQIILESLCELKYVKKLVVKNNELSSYESLGWLRQLLGRIQPNQLDELRLNNCKMSAQFIEDLFEIILECKSLRKFSLIRANIQTVTSNMNTITNLIKIIQNVKTLVELDISWNEMTPGSMKEITAALASNRRIKYLNLSWNSMTTNENLGLRNLEKDPNKISKTETAIMDNLCEFMKYNQELQVLDLSHTGLNYAMLLKIGPTLRKAKSLISLNLSGNPGISEQLITVLHERVHCVPNFEPRLTCDIITKDHQDKNQDGFGVQNQITEGLKLKQYKEAKNRNDAGGINTDDKFNAVDSQMLVFDRFLGHKKDIPGSGQWRQLTQVSQKPWVSNHYVYSLIFWNKSAGWAGHETIDLMDEELMIQKLKENHSKIRTLQDQGQYKNGRHPMAYQTELGQEKTSPQVPVIFGNFTDWCPRKMIPIESYCEMIDQSPPDYLGKMIADNKCRPAVTDVEDLNGQELEWYEAAVNEHKKTYINSWRTTIEHNLEYEEPNLVNMDHLGVLNDKLSKEQVRTLYDADPVFVYPCFMKPGKHYYMVRLDPKGARPSALTVRKSETPSQTQSEDLDGASSGYGKEDDKSIDLSDEPQDVQYFSHTMMAPYRIEEIPTVVKQYGSKSSEVGFRKMNSVFKEWKESTVTRLQQCCDHDFGLWKLTKFVKDEEQQDLVIKLIQRSMETLKIIHIYYAARSNFPHINGIEFNHFIQQFKIPDKNLATSGIKICHTASYSNMGKLEGAQDNMLLRFQLIECFIRLANIKYKESGRVHSYSDALRMFIDKDLKANCMPILMEWDGFRKNQLWTVEVNDLFKVNVTNVQILMEKYYQPRQKYLSMKDAIGIFSRDTDCLLEKDALFVYGMSKMPNPNETKEIRNHRKILHYTEMLEMIGRTAEFKYKQEEDVPLTEKICRIMDKIFPLVNVKRVQAKRGQGPSDESMSDDEY